MRNSTYFTLTRTAGENAAFLPKSTGASCQEKTQCLPFVWCEKGHLFLRSFLLCSMLSRPDCPPRHLHMHLVTYVSCFCRPKRHFKFLAIPSADRGHGAAIPIFPLGFSEVVTTPNAALSSSTVLRSPAAIGKRANRKKSAPRSAPHNAFGVAQALFPCLFFGRALATSRVAYLRHPAVVVVDSTKSFSLRPTFPEMKRQIYTTRRHNVCIDHGEFCKGARQSDLVSVWQHTLVG